MEGSVDGRGIAAVALRIWGLVLLLGAVATIPGSILAARATPWPPEQAELIRASQNASMFQLGASAILGLCLLLWADAVAHWAIPETSDVHIGVDTPQLLTVGLVLVGVGILIQGLEASATLAYVLMRKPEGIEIGAPSYLWERQSETMVKAVVDVVAGATLVLGRAGLARALAQVRSIVKTGHGLTMD
jgi:hypothetical protein